jgi:aerobic carbon-monoxide dehydrogenase medium subunit
MKPAPFDYVRANSIDEAVKMIASGEGDVMPIAGGQSLVPLLALRMTAPERLVDIGRIDALRQISESASHVTIGAGVTHADIEDGRVPDPANGLMRRIAGNIAYRAVRNQGTIGGSIALADPAADWPACLIALQAKARIAGPNGERSLLVEDLIDGIYSTKLERGELIVAFDIPKLAASSRTGVAKVARKTGAFAMSLAIAVHDGASAATRVVLGGAGSKPVCLKQTSELLHAKSASEPDLRAAIAHELDAIDGDLDAYACRLHTATVLRAVAEARPQ